jgi:hypothetical protein
MYLLKYSFDLIRSISVRCQEADKISVLLNENIIDFCISGTDYSENLIFNLNVGFNGTGTPGLLLIESVNMNMMTGFRIRGLSSGLLR